VKLAAWPGMTWTPAALTVMARLLMRGRSRVEVSPGEAGGGR
jgi:hypothetical protein